LSDGGGGDGGGDGCGGGGFGGVKHINIICLTPYHVTL